MPAIVKRFAGDLDITYEAVDANLNGGEVVIPSTTATTDTSLQGVKVAGDAALNVLGVASKPCVTNANQAAANSGTGAAPGSYPFADAGVPSAQLAVYNNVVCLVTYTAVAVPYGAKLAAAAAGAVRAWVTGDGAAAIIGWCAQPGGVSSAGGQALARIDV